MYQRCISPRCTGLCRPVRPVPACSRVAPARWHSPTRSGTSRNSLRSPFFGFASRGSWVRFPSSPPSVTRRDSPQRSANAAARSVKTEDRSTERGTVSWLVRRYVASRTDIMVKAREQYEWAIPHIENGLGAIQLSRLDREDVATWIDGLAAGGRLGRRSIQICRTVLRAARRRVEQRQERTVSTRDPTRRRHRSSAHPSPSGAGSGTPRRRLGMGGQRPDHVRRPPSQSPLTMVTSHRSPPPPAPTDDQESTFDSHVVLGRDHLGRDHPASRQGRSRVIHRHWKSVRCSRYGRFTSTGLRSQCRFPDWSGPCG